MNSETCSRSIRTCPSVNVNSGELDAAVTAARRIGGRVAVARRRRHGGVAIGRVAEDERLRQVGVVGDRGADLVPRRRDEVEEDAGLREEPGDELVVRLLVLHAVGANGIGAGEVPPVGEEAEDVVDHRREREILEDARVLPAPGQPHARHDAGAVLLYQVHLSHPLRAELGDDALDHSPASVRHRHRERRRLREDRGLELGRVDIAPEDDLVREEPRIPSVPSNDTTRSSPLRNGPAHSE